MSVRKILVVGGVAGGATAAARARRTDEHAEIIMFEKGPYISFANCGLPYYIGGEIGDRSALLLQTPETFNERFNVDVRVFHQVVAIDREAKQVRVRNAQTGEEYQESYTSLILAPGSYPIKPNLPGINLPNVYTVRTVPDSDAIKEYVEKHKAGRAVVVGAGFIGLEMVENLHNIGLQVTLVEKANQVLPPLDPEMATYVGSTLMNMGVEVILGDGIASFQGEDSATSVKLESGRVVEGDLFILGLGVRPDTAMAKEAGLELGVTGAIKVDDHQRTSDPNIYAAGDAVEMPHLVTGKPTWIPLAGPANKQGRVAGSNAAGDELTFPGALGTAIVRVGEMVAASTGLSEKAAKKEGLDYCVSYSVFGDHADYYPGWQDILTKLVVEKGSGRLLGAQLIGANGVDKRTDVFATAIAARMTVDDITNLDLAYAPPFGSAKDPAVVAAMVAQNIRRGTMASVTAPELMKRIEVGEQLQILDVRPSYEYEMGAIPGAINIEVDQVRHRLSELDPTLETVVYDTNGSKAYLAVRVLMQHGFRVSNLAGGYTIWPVYAALQAQGLL